MWFVYQRSPGGGDDEDEDAGMSLSRAWVMFGLVSVGVIIAGVFLAQSVDRVADLTGISSGVLGILAVVHCDDDAGGVGGRWRRRGWGRRIWGWRVCTAAACSM